MNNVMKTMEELKANWSEPKNAIHAGEPVAVPLVCRFEPAADEENLEDVKSIIAVPPELLQLWQCTNGASLFVDEVYGQWGLRLWPAQICIDKTKKFAINRPEDFRHGDLVVGEFLGDSDVLIVRCDPAADDYGSVIVALPLDDRTDWDRIGISLGAFLHSYTKTHGEKFWG